MELRAVVPDTDHRSGRNFITIDERITGSPRGGPRLQATAREKELGFDACRGLEKKDGPMPSRTRAALRGVASSRQFVERGRSTMPYHYSYDILHRRQPEVARNMFLHGR